MKFAMAPYVINWQDSLVDALPDQKNQSFELDLKFNKSHLALVLCFNASCFCGEDPVNERHIIGDFKSLKEPKDAHYANCMQLR